MPSNAVVVSADPSPASPAGLVQPLTQTPEGRLRVDASVSVSTSDPANVGTITSVADQATSITVLAANAARKGATFFNDSTSILYLALSSVTASATVYSVQIQAGGFYELPPLLGGVYTGICVGIWSADASGSVRVTEYT